MTTPRLAGNESWEEFENAFNQLATDTDHKGIHDTGADLAAKHPTGESGWGAIVVNTKTYWQWTGAAWADSGVLVAGADGAAGADGSAHGRDVIAVNASDTDLSTGSVFTWTSPPYAITLTDIEFEVFEAPTGSGIIVDLHAGGTTVMTTDKLDIDATEKHTKDAATQPALTTTAIAASTAMDCIVDQVGSTTAGKGGILHIYYTVD